MAELPFQQKEREKQRISFMLFFRYTTTFLGLPDFPTAHKYSLGEMPRCLCCSDVPRLRMTLLRFIPRWVLTSRTRCLSSEGTVQGAASNRVFTNSRGNRRGTRGGLELDSGCFLLYFQLRQDLNTTSWVEQVVREI